LEKNLIIDFVGEIADKDVEVVGGIFLVGGVGLVSPVDADFLYIKSEICGGPKVNCKIPLGEHVCRSRSAWLVQLLQDRRIQQNRN
jgi:hypothetical protein